MGIAASDPQSRYRRAERRLRALLLGDGVYEPGIAKGEESRSRAARELRVMREAFDEIVRGGGDRVEQVEARLADLEEELKRLASATTERTAARRRKAS